MADRPSPKPQTGQTRQTTPQNETSILANTLAPIPWNQSPYINILISGLYSDITTRHLHDNFHGYGAIEFIDIKRRRDGTTNGCAVIRFNPPPQTKFWAQKRFNLRYEGKTRAVQVGLGDLLAGGEDMVQVRPGVEYRARIAIKAQCLQFGVFVEENVMMKMRHVQPVPDTAITFGLETRKKLVTIIFGVPLRFGNDPTLRSQPTRIQIHLSKLEKLYRTRLRDGNWALILPLDCPPHYYKKRNNVHDSFQAGRLSWHASDAWIRITDIVAHEAIVYRKPVALNLDYPDDSYIDIGRWTVLRMEFNADTNGTELLSALHDFNIKIIDDIAHEIAIGQSPSEVWEMLDEAKTQLAVTRHQSALSLLSDIDHEMITLPFEVRYQLEALFSRHILVEQTIGREFLQKLASMPSEKARHMLEYFADKGNCIYDPMKVFEDGAAAIFFPLAMVPSYCAVIRKVAVTPTTMHLGLPAIEVTNRVIRHYEHLQDRFLRVQFTDELSDRQIRAGDLDRNDAIYSRVYRALTKGIQIGGRTYEFLAFGNSQIRECGAYFFCPTEYLSCDEIRQWMGSFNHIKVVAKYAARLGQCFSTTRQLRAAAIPNILMIRDIERNGYCFTDGVGKMSKFLADMVVEEMGLVGLETPSAFQFRLGGSKGMLTVWPEAKLWDVHVRDSQKKFTAGSKYLEIIKCARYSTATLNRQTITILSCLGIPAKAFMDLLQYQLHNYENALKDAPAAVELLQKYVDENQTTLLMADMLRNGFMHPTVREPFVMTLMQLWKVWCLKQLKEKARIIVEKSAFLLGCADETGTLRGHSKATEGRQTNNMEDLPQIFLQIPDAQDHRKGQVVKGLCIVGRNPSLHPGDIRVVQAVDVAALRHLRNVVVFPSKGDRDVPSMCSGGDLDGDEYFIIWDQSLVPKEWHHPPMNFRGPRPQELGRDVDVRDLAEFFVSYMKNNVLSKIALAHLAKADSLLKGAKDPDCLRLAELHSIAVDYAKTGIPAIMPKNLEATIKPDFMEQNGRGYRSASALGQIYRTVQRVDFKPLYNASFDRRILGRYKPTEYFLQKARQLKGDYDHAMRRIMLQRDIATEFEVWTGFALSRPRVGSDYKVSEDLGRESAALKQRFRDLCGEVAGGKSFTDLAPFVAAMYKVTEEEVRAAFEARDEDCKTDMQSPDGLHEALNLTARSMPLISFPWIFHHVLGYIATHPHVVGPQSAANIAKQNGTAMEKEDMTKPRNGHILHRRQVVRLSRIDEPTADKKQEEATNSLDASNMPMSQPFHADAQPATNTRLDAAGAASESLKEGIQMTTLKAGCLESDKAHSEQDLPGIAFGISPGPTRENEYAGPTVAGSVESEDEEPCIDRLVRLMEGI